MLLTLLRHAQTQPARHGQEDWDRELEARGRRDAPQIARTLADRGAIPTMIISSPAVRALETARLAASIFGIAESDIVQDERLYLADPKVMLDVVRERGGAASHLMIVGHNPGITEFADRLSAERSLDNMPTCSAYTLRFDIEHWQQLDWAEGFDAEFEYPR